jgi:hypothetical protein
MHKIIARILPIVVSGSIGDLFIRSKAMQIAKHTLEGKFMLPGWKRVFAVNLRKKMSNLVPKASALIWKVSNHI